MPLVFLGQQFFQTVNNLIKLSKLQNRMGQPGGGTNEGLFGGRWNASVSGYSFDMNLRQDGNRVTGNVDGGRAILDGVVTGRAMRFRYRYTDRELRGARTLVLSSNGRSFTGSYSHTDDPGNGSRRFYNGQRP